MNTSMLAVFSSRWLKVLVAVLALAGFCTWFYLNEQGLRHEAWTGVVQKKWEDKPLWKGSRTPTGKRNYNRTPTYYVEVKRDDGPVEKWKVPSNVYTASSVGSKLRKIYGERFPRAW